MGLHDHRLVGMRMRPASFSAVCSVMRYAQAMYALAAQHPWRLPPAPRRLPRRAARLLPLLQRMTGAPSCIPPTCSHGHCWLWLF
jgi:hypothetical protein